MVTTYGLQGVELNAAETLQDLPGGRLLEMVAGEKTLRICST